jgi:4-hydroxy-tetrahydrodipicolinate synthase
MTRMLQAPLRGIVTPLATPLAGPDNLDASGLERLVEHVIAGGVTGVFILGTTGEGPSLSHRLRRQMIERTCDLVGGRIPVLVGISDTSLTESERLAENALKAGAAAAVLAPPYYFLYSQTDLIQYLELIAPRISLPLFLYNIPQLTKVAFEPETVAWAAEIPGIAGLKDSSSDLTYLARVVELLRTKPEFTLLTGPEEILAASMRAGSHGGVCGGSNLRPALFMDLYRAAASGDWIEAERLQAIVLEMSEGLYRVGDTSTSYLRGIKCALSLAGLCRADLAPPLSPFTAAEYRALERGFQCLQSGSVRLRPAGG